MAAPAPTDKVKDKEYTNWLKVTLALYYMKSGLHTFIQNEADCLHQSLLQKIYAGQPVPTACVVCNVSLARRNKYTGVWTFQNQCRLSCDAWFHELLALHNNPKSDKIYWANSDVSLWPFNPWECAKVFLPRGQQPTNTGPTESDAQALMVLLANCKHFHPKLSPQGQTFTHMISKIRNKVMHDGEMKISDADRMSFMQQIVQFLEDPVHLKSLEDCKTAVSNIHKINNDSVDVFFNLGLEMTALRAVVEEFRKELGMQEKTNVENVNSLKEEFTQLREQLRKGLENTEKKLEFHGARVEENVEKLQEVQVNVALHGQQLDAVEESIYMYRGRLGTVEENVDMHGERLGTVEENVDMHGERLGNVEGNLEMHGQRLGTVEENVDMHGERLGTVEENVDMHGERLGTVEGNVDMHGGRLGTVEENVDMHGKRLGTVEENVDMHGERLGTVEGNLEMHGQRLGTVEENVDVHGERLGTVEENVDMHGERLGTVEGNLEMHGQRLGTVEENVDIHGERLGTVEGNLEMHEKRLGTVEENVDIHGERLGTVEGNLEMHGQRLGTVEENVDMHGGRIGTVEERLGAVEQNVAKLQEETRQRRENNSFIQEAPTRRKRPESDGLRQLKNETEDILDTFRRKGFIQTTQTEEAKKRLRDNRFVVISGNPGEGKTSTAFHLIDDDDFRNQCVVVKTPKHWKKVDTDWVKIVVLEDIFGRYDLDPDCLKMWVNKYLQTIQDHVDVGKLQVIITIRKDILLKAYSKIKSFKLFSSDMSVTLSSNKLKHSDKMSILNRELQRKSKDMNVGEKEQCIAKFRSMIGFPQCCSLFAQDKYLFSQGPDFFKSPEKFLVDNIRNLEPNSFLSLAYLFCIGEIEEEYLASSPMKESKKYLPVLENLAKYLHISFDESTVISLRESYDHYSGLYVRKVPSYKHHSGGKVSKSCIQFSHATVCEAVGQVLGEKCPEMVVKYGDSEYLYQRTYTAEARDDDSQNVFIPLSVYGLMVDRIVHDVIEKGIVESVVKHSVFKRNQFLMKLKDELHKCNRIKDFFMANYTLRSFDFLKAIFHFPYDVSDGKCTTFLQYVLQSDDGTVKLVYSQFMEFLACTHRNNTSNCWKCKEKQRLLELALYYHHHKIADKLIAMNACYTNVSLCNAARHGDPSRVQIIRENLKRSQAFNPKCVEAKKALCRAYLSRSQDVIEILLQEGITLDSMHVLDVVQQGDIHVLMKVVEHLKCHNMWHLTSEQDEKCWYNFHPRMCSTQFAKRSLDYVKFPCSTALYIAYCNEKFDMADYLLKNEAKVSLKMFEAVAEHGSKEAVARVIQDLKVNCNWDPHCDDGSKILGRAYKAHKYDVCDMLDQEGVSMTMKHFDHVILSSLGYVKTVVKQLKHTDRWDPRCNHASEALAIAYREKKYDVCALLIQEGVSLMMKNLPDVVGGFKISLEDVKKAAQNLKDTKYWDSKCEDASKALEKAYREKKYDVCTLLIQEGVSLTMKNLPDVVGGFKISLEAVKKALQHLKDTKYWDTKCKDASKALENAYREKEYDVCDLLIQEGVSLTMKNLPNVVEGFKISLEDVKKALQHLKDTKYWDSKCEDASKALAKAYREKKYDVCNLLIQEGVSLTMKNLPDMFGGFKISLENVKKALQHLKDTKYWDSKCEDASKALEKAYREKKYDVCTLLIQEGVSLTMKNLPYVVGGFKVSLEDVKKALQHLKDTKYWDSKCEDASKALENAYREKEYDVCDLLIQEGVSLTMKNLPNVVEGFKISLVAVKKALQHLKDTKYWDSKCEDASKALENAYREKEYDVCDLLIQEGVSLTMKNLPNVVGGFKISLVAVKKALQHLKDTKYWDSKCEDASKALENAYREKEYDVCDLLIQEGVSLTMKNLPYVVGGYKISLEAVKKALQHLKDTKYWDPNCKDASITLEAAYGESKYDVCDLLIQEGVLLTMKNLRCMFWGCNISLEAVKKAVQHLKDTKYWHPKCEDASKVLEEAYKRKKNEVCDLLIQEGVSLTMKNLPHLVGAFEISLETVRKVVQHLKDTHNWDPKCEDASKAIVTAYIRKKNNLCGLLIKEGVSLPMKNLPHVEREYHKYDV